MIFTDQIDHEENVPSHNNNSGGVVKEKPSTTHNVLAVARHVETDHFNPRVITGQLATKPLRYTYPTATLSLTVPSEWPCSLPLASQSAVDHRASDRATKTLESSGDGRPPRIPTGEADN